MTYQSRWGYHPCDYETYLKLRRLHRAFWEGRRLLAKWRRGMAVRLAVPGGVAVVASDPATLDTLRLVPQNRHWKRTRSHPDGVRAFSDGKLPSGLPHRARQRAAGQEARSNPSCGEALATGTMRDRVRVRHFEAALLQIVAVIEERSANEERALR